MKYHSKKPEDTKKIAEEILKKFPGNRLFYLYGDLASGKTTFTKGLAEAIGIPEKKIKSPTFAFISEYPGLIHCDLYRLEEADESIFETLKEYASSNSILVIEWPEIIEDYLQIEAVKIRFKHIGDDSREIEVF